MQYETWSQWKRQDLYCISVLESSMLVRREAKGTHFEDSADDGAFLGEKK